MAVKLKKRWTCHTVKDHATHSPSKNDTMSLILFKYQANFDFIFDGTPAFFRYSEAAAAMQHSCSCCKETRFSNRTIDLLCLTGEKIPFTYMHVEECGCGQTACTKPAGLPSRRKRSFTLQWQNYPYSH